MSFPKVLASLLILLTLLTMSARPAMSANMPARGSFAFVDVNVVPMESDGVLLRRTVIVQGDTIVTVGPAASTPVPEGAVRIEGGGKAWLVPGLADMHTHVGEEDDLGLFIANGVTTVLHLGGTEQKLVGYARDAILTGEIVGPQMFFGMMVNGPNTYSLPAAKTVEESELLANYAKLIGYDFLKVYNDLSPTAFAALVARGRTLGLPVIGHGVRAVGLPAALFKGQMMVAHAEEFVYTALDGKQDAAAIDALAAEVKRSNAFVTPALSTFEAIAAQWGKPAQVTAYLTSPQAEATSLRARSAWNRSFYMRRQGDVSGSLVIQRKLTLAFQKAGVPLMTGTDTPEVPGMFPGYAVHEDLRNLIVSGLTPYEALAAATRTPGQFIRSTHPGRQPFGTVKAGQRADLVLVGANPLTTIETMKVPAGVMAAGRWFDRAGLDALLSSRRERYRHLDQAK